MKKSIYLALLALAFCMSLMAMMFAAGANASEPEDRPYSALDTLRRAEVGTYSPVLREVEREQRPLLRERSDLPFAPRWEVRCRIDPIQPDTLVCEERR